MNGSAFECLTNREDVTNGRLRGPSPSAESLGNSSRESSDSSCRLLLPFLRVEFEGDGDLELRM